MLILRRIFQIIAALIVAVVMTACVAHFSNSGQPSLPTQPENALRLASSNVHYIILSREEGAWSVGDWEARKGALDAAFKDLDADIIGFQEMESFQRGSDGSVNLARDYLAAENPDYSVGANGDWREFPPTQPIFYRTARLEQIDQGWFFFSDTPDQIYSRGFDGNWPSFASWSQFRDRKTSAVFRVVNIHTDFSSAENRTKSAELIANRVSPWIDAGERVFVLGDFNALNRAPTISRLRETGLQLEYAKGSTYHLDRGINLFGAIDHIMYGPGIEVVNRPVALRRKYDGEWPSDHYPIMGDYNVSK